MANHKATKKDARQALKRRERNRYYGKTTRNAIRKLLATSDKAAAGQELPGVGILDPFPAEPEVIADKIRLVSVEE